MKNSQREVRKGRKMEKTLNKATAETQRTRSGEETIAA